MNDDAIKQFSDVADALQQHVRELSPTVVAMVSSTNKANQDVRVVSKPASIGSYQSGMKETGFIAYEWR